MWARRCGAKPRWPSRVKVVFFSFLSGTLGLSVYMYMSRLNTSSLDLSRSTSEQPICLTSWPQRYDQVFTLTMWNGDEEQVLFKAPGADEEFFAKYNCEVPATSGTLCRDVRFHTQDLQRPLALAMGAAGFDYDLMGAWALWWLLLTLVAWLGVTIHDLALIGQSQKDFVLDVAGVNKHCPCIRSVWKFLAGYKPLARLAADERFGARSLGVALAVLLAPVLLVWNLVVLLFIMCPLILFAFMRYPVRMSRAWVFIISVACVLYGAALTMQQLAFVAHAELRPRYALTWEAKGLNVASQTSLCTCGCDYSMSLSVCVNLGAIGLVTTVKSAFLAFRCLKGLRRSQWANLLSVTFPVPLTVYAVDWQQADGQPIRFRSKDMPVQGEVAFDPFAMMDEQPDSAYTTVHLHPEHVHRYEKSEHGELRVLQPSRQVEMPRMPMPSRLDSAQFKAVIEAEYIGCCGFPWPTGGKKFVYDEDFLEALERGGLDEAVGPSPSSVKSLEEQAKDASDAEESTTTDTVIPEFDGKPTACQVRDCGRPSSTWLPWLAAKHPVSQPREDTPLSVDGSRERSLRSL